jgi:cytochrome c2
MNAPAAPASPSRRRKAAALGLPLLGAALLFAIAWLYLGLLALDLRALLDSSRMTNYEPPVLADRWIAAAEPALRWAGLPLLSLALLGGALRLRARLLGGGVTLARLPTGLRVALAALVGAPFLAFVVPFALALGTWVLIEIVPWVQWYDNLEKLSDPVLRQSVPPLAAATLLAGAWALAAVLRRAAAPVAEPSRRRRLARWAWRLGIVAPIGLAAALPALGVAVHAVRVAPALGRSGALERNCWMCHDATAPLYFYKAPREWERFLGAGCFRRAALTAEERLEILDFVTTTRSFSDAWIFRTRCQRCHMTPHRSWERRTPEDWAAITRRLAYHSPFYFGPDAREQVVAHLSRTLGADPPSDPQAQQEWRTVEACGACHFVSRGAERWRGAPDAELRALVRRMGDRREPPWSDAEVETLAATWQALVADPERLRALAPHDRPVLEGDLPW